MLAGWVARRAFLGHKSYHSDNLGFTSHLKDGNKGAKFRKVRGKWGGWEEWA